MQYGTMPGPRAQMVRLVTVFSYIWLEDVEKIPKVSMAYCNVNPARATAWSVGVTLYFTIFQLQIISISQDFTRDKILLKKISKRNAH